MNFKILMHIMPWEIDYAMLSFAQLKKSQNYLPDDVNVEFECILNLSSYAIDWDKSILPKEYFIKKYYNISIGGRNGKKTKSVCIAMGVF